MKFLKEIDFTDEEINALVQNVDKNIIEKCKEFPVLIIENLKYLKNLGVTNYKMIFADYSEMFLKDNSAFESIFSKYDTEDLIDKITKNPGIVEYL